MIRSPATIDPRYKGSVKGYSVEDCPTVESFRKRLCLSETRTQTLAKVENELKALRATIHSYR